MGELRDRGSGLGSTGVDELGDRRRTDYYKSERRSFAFSPFAVNEEITIPISIYNDYAPDGSSIIIETIEGDDIGFTEETYIFTEPSVPGTDVTVNDVKVSPNGTFKTAIIIIKDSGSDDTPQYNFTSPVAFGDQNDNILSGGDGDDRVLGDDGNDYLNGGGGNDILAGENGKDTLDGGTGDDIFTGGDQDDALNGGTGNDNLFGDNGNDTLDGGAGDDKLKAYRGDDVLLGNSGNDYLDGYYGNDYLDGGDGNDILDGWDGIDILYGGDGDDTLLGGIAVSSGSLDGDTLFGGNGNDSMWGEGGNDTLFGGDGNDTLDGRSGIAISAPSDFDTDNLYGGLSDDSYIVDSTTADTITEYFNEGTDTVQSSVNFTLGNNLENLTLTGSSDISGTGNAVNNTITGNDANNSLFGFDGNDTLTGGVGKDTLTGGTGVDKFVFYSPSEGIDTITDFKWSEGDKIEVSAIGFGIVQDQYDRFRLDRSTGDLFFGETQFASLQLDSGFIPSQDITIV